MTSYIPSTSVGSADEDKLRQQLLERLSHVRTPSVELHIGIAERAEVTREQTAVTELLRSKAAFR